LGAGLFFFYLTPPPPTKGGIRGAASSILSRKGTVTSSASRRLRVAQRAPLDRQRLGPLASPPCTRPPCGRRAPAGRRGLAGRGRASAARLRSHKERGSRPVSSGFPDSPRQNQEAWRLRWTAVTDEQRERALQGDRGERRYRFEACCSNPVVGVVRRRADGPDRATIAIRASSEAPVLPPRASLSRRARRPLAHAIFARVALAAAALSGLSGLLRCESARWRSGSSWSSSTQHSA
jgi:hypothetical protein